MPVSLQRGAVVCAALRRLRRRVGACDTAGGVTLRAVCKVTSKPLVKPDRLEQPFRRGRARVLVQGERGPSPDRACAGTPWRAQNANGYNHLAASSQCGLNRRSIGSRCGCGVGGEATNNSRCNRASRCK